MLAMSPTKADTGVQQKAGSYVSHVRSPASMSAGISEECVANFDPSSPENYRM